VAHSGANVYATGLNANILPFAGCYLRSPAINLTGINRATLTFYEWRNLSSDPIFQGTRINILDAGTLSLLQEISSESGPTVGYQQRIVPIPPNLLNRQIVVEFFAYTDDFNLLEGWYIDDVKILQQ
jgi:hypothetical protein